MIAVNQTSELSATSEIPTDTVQKEEATVLSSALHLAYLVSEFPALSHTFIDREIDALVEGGVKVSVASIRQPANLATMGERGQQLKEETFYVLANLPSKILPAAFRLLFTQRISWFEMIGRALRAIRQRPLRLASYVYFFEAIVLLDWMLQNGMAHVHNHFGNAAGTVSWIAAGSRRVDFSLSIHGPDVFYDVENELLPSKLRDAKFARAISWYCLSQLCLLTEQEHWGKFDIVRCGIDPNRFKPVKKVRRDSFELLCVGRLVAAKGQHVLVEAVHLLKARGKSLQLTLVGTGPDEDSLRLEVSNRGLEDCIQFTGGLGQPDVLKLYRRANAFAIPSFAEGVPVVLMEAMACEVPVISTTITGIGELITSGESGLLVPPANAEELANVIQMLIDNPDESDRYAKNGRIKVIADYNLEKNGPQMAQFFLKRLSKP